MEGPLARQPNSGRRYALCVGIGTYCDSNIRNLSYAANDARAVASVFSAAARGNFEVKLLTQAQETTRDVLMDELDNLLSDREPDDLVMIYFSCHGEVYGAADNKTFCLLPSDTVVLAKQREVKGRTVIDVYDLAKMLSNSRVKNVVMLLDVCYSGGAGEALQYIGQKMSPNSSLFIIAAAQRDQVAKQSSRLQHGIFTHALLQAFQEKPHRSDGWLTISQIASFVKNAVEAYPSSEINGFFMSAQARNPNLPIVKNPHYSVESEKFSQQVRQLLEVLRYDSLDMEIPQAPTGFWVAEVQMQLGEQRVGVIPRYNRVEDLTLEDVQGIVDFVRKQVEKEALDLGLLVLAKEVVGGEVKDVLDEYRSSCRMMIRTIQDIWKNLINFRRYLGFLIEQYESPDSSEPDGSPALAQVYVPLQTKQGDLEKEVRAWLSDEDATATRCAILADYGSGKSTFCQHLAAQLSKEYQSDTFSNTRIPLVIPLGEFSRSLDLETHLISHLRKCRVEIADTDALMKMAAAGMILFMFDGFDEMASRATTDVLRKNIERIEQWAEVRRNKVLVTTRPEYFLSLHEEQDILQRYRRLGIQPLNEEQINLYLQKRIAFLKASEGGNIQDWTYYRQEIDKVYNLTDLMRRPVLLEMVITTFPALVARGREVNRPDLYREYLEGELERQNRKPGRFLSIRKEMRFEIMERIALELYRTKSTQLSSVQIELISDDLLAREQPGAREGFLREIVTCSFLIRKGDTYHFSHESFLEYLVANQLAKALKNQTQEHYRLRLVNKTIQEFLLEIIKPESVQETTFENEYVKVLERWFREHPQDSPLSANVFSLLVRVLPHEQLYNLPLQAADLMFADLSGAQLQQAPLAGVHLEGADLRGARLEGVDLRSAHSERADLRGAHLEGADIKNAYLEGADLRGAHLERADLSNARLAEADLSGAHLEGADLHGANLKKAKLIKANLTGTRLMTAYLDEANLTEAVLFRARLEGANLNGANLTGANLLGAVLFGTHRDGAPLSGVHLDGANL